MAADNADRGSARTDDLPCGQVVGVRLATIKKRYLLGLIKGDHDHIGWVKTADGRVWSQKEIGYHLYDLWMVGREGTPDAGKRFQVHVAACGTAGDALCHTLTTCTSGAVAFSGPGAYKEWAQGGAALSWNFPHARYASTPKNLLFDLPRF